MSAGREVVAMPLPSGPSYPQGPRSRDLFVLERREARPALDPWRPQGALLEDERAEDGRIARVATVFLTGRECRWRCAMCDLWRHTLAVDTPSGAIPAQIDLALSELAEAGGAAPTHIKLFNASSVFDPQAVSEADYDPIALRLTGIERVVVESHPALLGARVDRFQGALDASLEVAMGLETAHPTALESLNKRMTLDQFARAAEALLDRRIAVRAFVLVSPPFVPREQQDEWLARSVDFAFACGASVVSLIPTRPGNGAVEALAADGRFRAPSLADLERSFALGLERSQGRVLADLWDLDRLPACAACSPARAQRLRFMNLEQRVRPRIECAACVDRGAL
jgi:radical SAM enzyme (TIGR01210 family)